MKPFKPSPSLSDSLKKKVEKGAVFDYENGQEDFINIIKTRPPGEYNYKETVEAEYKATIDKMVAEISAAEAAKQAQAIAVENRKWQELIEVIIDVGLYDELEAIDLVNRLRERGKNIEDARNVFEIAIESARRDKLERERKEAAAKIPKPSAYGSWA